VAVELEGVDRPPRAHPRRRVHAQGLVHRHLELGQRADQLPRGGAPAVEHSILLVQQPARALRRT
jgi:hypothetical protein